MEIIGWLAAHGLDLQTVSGAAGLLATIYTISAGTRERKIGNLFAVTAAHRELWTWFAEHPEVHRVLEEGADLGKEPPTLAESRFVHELILHLRTSFKARKAGMEFDDDSVTSDIRQFFAKPIPRWVWDRSKAFQGRDFVEFVEGCF